MVLYSATNVFGRGWPGVVVVLPGAGICHYANATRFISVSDFIGLRVCCLAKIIHVLNYSVRDVCQGFSKPCAASQANSI